jgi:hypothetical protein
MSNSPHVLSVSQKARGTCFPVLAMRLRIRALLHASRKPFVPPRFFPHDLVRKPQRHFSGSCGKKGGGAPTGAPRVPPRRRIKKACQRMRRAPSLSPARRGIERRRPRLSAPHRGPTPRVFIPRLGSGPRFLESPDPNGRTLSGTSAASTWQTGIRPAGRCPEPPGNGLRDRPREPHLLHLLGRTRNVPFDEQALTDAMYLYR